MLLTEVQISIPLQERNSEISLKQLAIQVNSALPKSFHPIRFVVTNNKGSLLECEIGGLKTEDDKLAQIRGSIFDYRDRKTENIDQFTTILLVPTGIGAEIGGHAGDAGPVARLLGEVSDTVVLHPNVVNASDINEMPANALYVEGSVICRLLMGKVGLQKVRNNRVFVVVDAHQDELFVNSAINAVGGARAAYGLNCANVVKLLPPIKLKARFASSGRSAGRVEEIDGLIQLLKQRRNDFDAVALSSVIDVPEDFHQGYFDSKGEMVNPWGGVEAMLTHALSMILDVPTAHSPMFENRDIANMDPGIVDPRMASEAVSATFLQCTLKGLQRSPRIITDIGAMFDPNVITAEHISCLVIPDKCLGLPTLAALEQGIAVVAVRENNNVMENDLTRLPWQKGQLHIVDSYLEAAGLVAALKAGITTDSVRRPLEYTKTELAICGPQKKVNEDCAIPIKSSPSDLT